MRDSASRDRGGPGHFGSAGAFWARPLGPSGHGKRTGSHGKRVHEGDGAALEPLIAPMAHRIREIAIKCKGGIEHERIGAKMEALDRLFSACDAVKRCVQLGEVLHIDHDVKLAEARRGKPKLFSGEPPSVYEAVCLEVAQVSIKLSAEGNVAHTGLQVTPDMVRVHATASVWS